MIATISKPIRKRRQTRARRCTFKNAYTRFFTRVQYGPNLYQGWFGFRMGVDPYGLEEEVSDYLLGLSLLVYSSRNMDVADAERFINAMSDEELALMVEGIKQSGGYRDPYEAQPSHTQSPLDMSHYQIPNPGGGLLPEKQRACVPSVMGEKDFIIPPIVLKNPELFPTFILIQSVDGTWRSFTAALLAGQTAKQNTGMQIGDRLTTVNDVLRNPNLLTGKGPAEIQAILGKSPGWQIEALGKGSHAGQGWVLREYTAAGSPTGRTLRWHPGGGHHGPNPYWRVTGGPDGKSGIIPGGAKP